MGKIIKLINGEEDNATIYNKITKYRDLIEKIAIQERVYIGSDVHKGNNTGARGHDLYNDIRGVLKKALGYEPKSGEKLKSGDKTKLEKLLEEADNYSLKLKKGAGKKVINQL